MSEQRDFEEPEQRRPGPSRFWVAWCVAFPLAAITALVTLMARDVVVCRNDLSRVAEPAGWRSWPVLPKLGGFRIKADSWCDEHGECVYSNTELRTSDLCPRGGVSVGELWQGWYSSGTDQVVSLRRSRGIYVAAIKNKYAPGRTAHDDFVVAFRRHTGATRPAFEHVWIEIASLGLLIVLLLMAAAGYRVLRLLRRRRRYRDSALYAPRELDALRGGLDERAAAIVRWMGRLTLAPVVATLLLVAVVFLFFMSRFAAAG